MPCQDCSQLKNSDSVSVLTPAVICSFSSTLALWIPLDDYVLRLFHGIPPQGFRDCYRRASKAGGVRQAQQSRLQVYQSFLNQTNSSVYSDIRISCKMSFGGGKMKCSASKKRIENHIIWIVLPWPGEHRNQMQTKIFLQVCKQNTGKTQDIWKILVLLNACSYDHVFFSLPSLQLFSPGFQGSSHGCLDLLLHPLSPFNIYFFSNSLGIVRRGVHFLT